MDPVLWWILSGTIATLASIVAFMLMGWQRRVERRMQRLHHHSNVLTWLVLVVGHLYRKVFGVAPPPPPEEEHED